MNVSCHARGRIRGYCGSSKKAVDRGVMRILQRGLRPEESIGNLRRYFDHLRRFERGASNIRIYGKHVYIFRDGTLVTVLTLPNEYQADMQEAMRRRIPRAAVPAGGALYV